MKPQRVQPGWGATLPHPAGVLAGRHMGSRAERRAGAALELPGPTGIDP